MPPLALCAVEFGKSLIRRLTLFNAKFGYKAPCSGRPRGGPFRRPGGLRTHAARTQSHPIESNRIHAIHFTYHLSSLPFFLASYRLLLWLYPHHPSSLTPPRPTRLPPAEPTAAAPASSLPRTSGRPIVFEKGRVKEEGASHARRTRAVEFGNAFFIQHHLAILIIVAIFIMMCLYPNACLPLS